MISSLSLSLICWLSSLLIFSIPSETFSVVLSQTFITSYISVKDKAWSISCQVSRNSLSWFPTDGSIWMDNPCGITSPLWHFVKKLLCDFYLAFLSFKLFSFKASFSFDLLVHSGTIFVLNISQIDIYSFNVSSFNLGCVDISKKKIFSRSTLSK